jgi:hypothetical protein
MKNMTNEIQKLFSFGQKNERKKTYFFRKKRKEINKTLLRKKQAAKMLKNAFIALRRKPNVNV